MSSALPQRSASVSSAKPPSSYPSPPPSARSPHSPPQNFRAEAFSADNDTPGRRRRGSSLSGKFPGDMSHRPLDQLSREKAVADKSRHSTRKHSIRPDSIDNLDDAAPSFYHHGGPYDATLFSRNNTKNSPLAALKDSNNEALKATPREKIADSVEGHRPLDGVAAYPPGAMDRNGHTYNYVQGENMMIAEGAGGGAYKRWPGVQYHEDDIKGKGEPSYSIEKAFKESKLGEKDDYRRELGEIGNATEMKPLNGSSDGHGRHVSRSSMDYHGPGGMFDDGEGIVGSGTNVQRKGSLSGLKKRIGSMGKHRRSGSKDE